MTIATPEPPPSLGFRLARIFVPFVLGYFLSFAFRTVNAVISKQLTTELGVAATALGLLTATYFIAFGACQPLVGVLIDRFGYRRVDGGLLLVAACGAALFATGHSLGELAVGRALIGMGVSSALMASLTAIGLWWPRERLPLMNGLFVATGALGAVFSTTPVQALLTITDWRGIFWGLAACTAAAALFILTTVPDRRPPGAGQLSLPALLGGLGRLLTSAAFWRLAPAMGFIQAVFMAYISLWAGPWLRDVHQLNPGEVAAHLQWAAMGMVAGYAGFGLIADALRALFGVRPLVVSAVGIACALTLQATLAAQLPLSPALTWPLYGFFAGAPFMGYAILTQQVPVELSGRANTALNLVMFAGSFAAQSAIGIIIDHFPSGEHGGYAMEGHTTALWVMLGLEVLAFAWMLRPGSKTASPHP